MSLTPPPDKAPAACDITHPDANAISFTPWWRSPTVLAIIAVGVLSGIYPDLPPRWERWDQAVLGILAALGIAWWIRQEPYREVKRRNGLNAKHREALDSFWTDEL